LTAWITVLSAGHKDKQPTCIPPDSFLPRTSFFPRMDLNFTPGFRRAGRPSVAATTRPGSPLGRGTWSSLQRLVPSTKRYYHTLSVSSELIVSIADSPTHTRLSPSRIICHGDHLFFAFLALRGRFIFQLAGLFHQDFTGLFRTSGQFHHRMLRHMDTTRGSLERCSRSCSPVACLRSPSGPPSLGRTPRSQPSGHLYGHDNLDPARLVFFSSLDILP
jgi:hypothetical protein